MPTAAVGLFVLVAAAVALLVGARGLRSRRSLARATITPMTLAEPPPG